MNSERIHSPFTLAPNIISHPARDGNELRSEGKTGGFGAVLRQQLKAPDDAPLTFSGHALQRLQQRRIVLTAEERLALSEATAKARDKGAKETLILADKAAFVVSVRNNTVITVMDRENLKDNLFTQIDSAMVI